MIRRPPRSPLFPYTPLSRSLLFPPLKSQRPTDEAGRSAEWSQWGVFCSVFALIVASGLENVAPLIIAGVLFLLALGYALVYARNGDFAVAVLLVAIVGVSVYLFLPIRAAHYPPINEGEPTTWKALWEVLTRQQYGKPPVWERQASLGAQIGMWFQYFSWQWGRDWYDSTFKLRSEEHTSELQSRLHLVCRLLL